MIIFRLGLLLLTTTYTFASTTFHQSSVSESNIGVPPVRLSSPSRLFESPSTNCKNLLQIPCSVFSTSSPIAACLDTGAQVTVISLPAAIRSGLSHLIDRSYSGMATGVGSVSIVGRISNIELEIGDLLVEVELIVLENTGGVDLLLGLDVLEDLGASICLNKRCVALRKNGEKTMIPFVNENEVSSIEDPDDTLRGKRMAFVGEARGGASAKTIQTNDSYSVPESEEEIYQEYSSFDDEDEDKEVIDGFDFSGI